MLHYQLIEIFTSEQARSGHKPVADAVIQYIRERKIAARCIVTRGIAGCYESGEMATQRLEILSFNLPLRIAIVLPAAQSQSVLAALSDFVNDGIVALHDLQVVSHHARNALLPRELKVRDAMTPDPKRVTADSQLSDVARLLLSSVFTGVPVVDRQERPIGVITQGDLIAKGGLPLRLGLLAESEPDRLTAVLNRLASRRAGTAMTAPAVTIGEDRPLTEAAELMLARGMKRLPVVNDAGKLSGMLSRLDIFQTIAREAPDWNAFRAQAVRVGHLRSVKDIVRRDTFTVAPEASIEEVLQLIHRNDIQRVAVVDATGTLMGLISDRDLLRYFKPQQKGIWQLFSQSFKAAAASDEACASADLRQCLRTTCAAAVMTTDPITVREEALIEEAIALMTEKGLKRLAVVDAAGRFKGMISRDSLLRTGFASSLAAGMG